MKKIISLLTILLILVGCSLNSSTQISDKDDVLFKIEDTSVTKGEVYNMLRYQQVGQIIINDAQNSAEILALLGFSDNYELCLCVGFGYANESPEAKPRDINKVQFVD